MTGADFRAAREVLGLSQAAMARALGVSRQQVYLMERKADVGPMARLAVRALVSDRSRELQAVA